MRDVPHIAAFAGVRDTTGGRTNILCSMTKEKKCMLIRDLDNGPSVPNFNG